MAAGCVSTACSVQPSLDAGEAGTQNTCDRSADCGKGECRASRCVAVSATLDALLLEVSLPVVGEGYTTGARYLRTQNLSDIRADEGFQIQLNDVALIEGRVVPDVMPGAECSYVFENGSDPQSVVEGGLDGSIPSTATFIPRERVLGVAPLSYTALSSSGTTSSSHRFEVRVTPGVYDVYLVPPKASDTGCPVAPLLMRNQLIESGAVDLSLPLPVARQLRLSVVAPPGASGEATLDNWIVDMIDPQTGYPISTSTALGGAHESVTGYTYEALLHYSPVWNVEDDAYLGEGEELVRFRPPDDVLAPTVILNRASLELFTLGEALVEQLGTLPTPVRVEGEVESLESGSPVAASLTFIATDIQGVSDGVLASYVVGANASDDGVFDVELLPGSYRVRAIPTAEACCFAPNAECDCPSTVELEWQISGAPKVQAGRTIQLANSPVLRGSIKTPGGKNALTGATIDARPAPIATSLLDRLLRDGAMSPRVASLSVDSAGEFAIAVDPGLFWITVRAEQDSGFAWLVHPGLSVESEATSVELGNWTMPLPVAYRGKVTFPDSETVGASVHAAGAMVRAYAYLDADGRPTNTVADAVSVIAVAESRADSRGVFNLLLPDALEER